MLQGKNGFSSPSIGGTAIAACAAVMFAAACGPVLKAALLEAARNRLTLQPTSQRHSVPRAAGRHGVLPSTPETGEHPSTDDQENPRNPGTDPVFTVCTHADWDRAAGRPPLEPPRTLLGATSGVRSGVSGSPVQVARWEAMVRWVPQLVAFNPNSRAHAPPAPHTDVPV